MTTDEPHENPDTSDEQQQLPTELAVDETDLRRQLEQLGFRPAVFRDESLGPQVDEEVLLRLIRREVPDEQASLVYRLVYSFRSWHEAHTRLLLEEYQRGRSANER